MWIAKSLYICSQLNVFSVVCGFICVQLNALGQLDVVLHSQFLLSLEGLAPYGGQISSSCRGLVAFGHQMGALRAPWLVKLKFWVLHSPPSSSCGGLMAFVHLIWAMFVYGFECFFVLSIMGLRQEVSLKAL